jgi:hypothetical protein
MVLLLLLPRPEFVIVPIGSMEDKMIEGIKSAIEHRNEKPQAPTTHLRAYRTA